MEPNDVNCNLLFVTRRRVRLTWKLSDGKQSVAQVTRLMMVTVQETNESVETAPLVVLSTSREAQTLSIYLNYVLCPCKSTALFTSIELTCFEIVGHILEIVGRGAMKITPAFRDAYPVTSSEANIFGVHSDH